MQAVLEQKLVKPVIAREPEAFGRKVSFLASLFGCWHKRLSRPMSDRNSTYQVCAECGARRRFDPEEFRAKGPFYYPSSVDTRLQRQGSL
jgi:hypothetical protein